MKSFPCGTSRARRFFPVVTLCLLACLLTACGKSAPTYYYLLESGEKPFAAPSLPATSLRIAHVENSLQRTLARQLSIYNSKMTLLGTIISGAPFLGLLGTVWGVMDSFGSMSGQSSVTLQQLAPGVAGALLTTVAGLVVAIPSVFGYNFLTTKARQLATETEIFASMIADKIEMESAARAGELLSSESKPSPAVAVSEKIDASPSGKIISFSLDDDVNSRDSD